MSVNKPHVLSCSFDEQEAKMFIAYAQKKERQLKLFHMLRDLGLDSFDKPKLFQSFYDEHYSKEKDYLLRNDLRKLSKLLIKFIEEELNQRGLDYFKLLIDKKLFALVDKELPKTITSIQKKSVTLAYPYQLLWFKYLVRYGARKQKDIDKYIKDLSVTIKHLPSDEMEYRSQLIMLYTMFERINWQYHQIEFNNISQFYNEAHLVKGSPADYFISNAHAWQLFGKERIEQLNQCISILHQNKSDLLKGELPYMESQLGLEYFLLPDYQQSQVHFEKAYALFDELTHSHLIQLIYNYVSMLCADKQYDKVIELLDEHIQIFEGTNFLNNMSIFRIMSYINLNQTDNLRTYLPNTDVYLSKDAEIYYRFMECIVLFFEENYEICSNFLENIYQSARYNDYVDSAYIDLSKLFQNFVHAKLIYDKDEQLKKLAICKSNSDDFINNYKIGFGSNMLISVWLNETITAHIDELR